MKKMIVPPTSRMPKTMQRIRSKTAAANFQSSFFSLSGSSAVSLRIFPLWSSSNSNRSVCVLFVSLSAVSVLFSETSCSRVPFCWKSPSSSPSLLQLTEDGVIGVVGGILMRIQDASFSRTNHFIWHRATAVILTGRCLSRYYQRLM